jgi:hypothetical protein
VPERRANARCLLDPDYCASNRRARQFLGWSALILLGLYAWTTFREALTTGRTAPPAEAPSGVDKLIDYLKTVLTANEDVPNDSIPSVVDAVENAYPGFLTSPGDDPSPRRIAALM